MRLTDFIPAGIAQPEQWTVDRIESDGYMELSRDALRLTRASDGTWQAGIDDGTGLVTSKWHETPLAAVGQLRNNWIRLSQLTTVFTHGQDVVTADQN